MTSLRNFCSGKKDIMCTKHKRKDCNPAARRSIVSMVFTPCSSILDKLYNFNKRMQQMHVRDRNSNG